MSLQSMLGIAGEGATMHWWAQRVSAVALIPLTLWFALSLLGLESFAHEVVVAWTAETFNGVMLILLLIATLYHSLLGVQVILEDYVQDVRIRAASMTFSKLVHLALGLAGIAAIISISSGAS